MAFGAVHLAPAGVNFFEPNSLLAMDTSAVISARLGPATSGAGTVVLCQPA
jgi:hypothetical protein